MLGHLVARIMWNFDLIIDSIEEGVGRKDERLEILIKDGPKGELSENNHLAK
jgi:hypothetical protein